MEKITKVVGAVIFDPETDSYFVGQRGRKKKVPLKWEFIGGKIEEGEDFISALEREFREEVGISISARKLVNTVVFDYGGAVGKVEINFIECDKFEDLPFPDPEVYEVCRWVLRKELSSLDWVEADKDFAISLAGNK